VYLDTASLSELGNTIELLFHCNSSRSRNIVLVFRHGYWSLNTCTDLSHFLLAQSMPLRVHENIPSSQLDVEINHLKHISSHLIHTFLCHWNE